MRPSSVAWVERPAGTSSLRKLSDDGVTVWFNGTETHRIQIGRRYGPKQDCLLAKLNERVNTLLLKLSRGGGD